jgi:CheY-like chemotaxis protein
MVKTLQNPCGQTVFVVDDDEDILKMTSFVLEKLGYAVKTESSADSALGSLASGQFKPCLILLDLMMPKMDGAEFRKKLLGIPGTSEIPIVVLSGDSELSVKVAGMNVAGFVQKPISVEHLSALAAKYCGAAG